MNKGKSTFALFFGNRGFFPSSLVAGAREELSLVLKQLGHEILIMPADATPYGAVETIGDAKKYARYFKDNDEIIQGILVTLPNFGDEIGVVYLREDKENSTKIVLSER